MIAFIDSQVVEDCMNHNSYGEICVGCNCCGRYGEEGKIEAQIKYYKESLEENKNFDDWCDEPFLKLLQQENIDKQNEYYRQKLSELGVEEV